MRSPCGRRQALVYATLARSLTFRMAPKRILAVGDSDSLAETGRFLRRSEFEMHRVPAALAARDMVRQIPFDLIILVLPLPDADFDEVHEAIRHPASRCRDSQLLVLTRRHRLAELDPFHRDPRLEAVAIEQPEHRLAAAAARYLGEIRAATRYRVSVPARLQPGPTEGRTVDISSSGARVAAGESPPLGARVSLELELPGGGAPLAFEAELVRRCSAQREGVEGFAVTYLEPSEAALRQLERFLENLDA